MVVIKKGELGIGKEIKGKINPSSGYGDRGYGAFHYGAGADTGGIYQVRTRFERKTQVKMKLYVPTNPQTAPQQAHRAKFSDGVVAWQALSEESKNGYRNLAESLDLTGFNLFMREYLHAN